MNGPLTLAAAGLGAWWLYRTLSRTSYSFRGRNAFVTGGSRGLGLVLARELLARGANVAVCARDAEELDLAYDDLQGRGGRGVVVRCDVTDEASVRDAIATVRGRLGPIDVLINNAGIIGVGPLETMTLDDFDKNMKVHFWASVYTTFEVMPEMRRRKQGRIVNVSSIGGKVAVPHLLPYVASKFALTGFSTGLRIELTGTGIAVTTVCPGMMRTGSHVNARFKGQHGREYAWFALGSSIPGLSISAESAARTILDACARGDGEVVLTLPAKIAVLMQALFPDLTADAAGVVGRSLLPGPGDGDTTLVAGHYSRGELPEFVTALPDRASEQNNELVGRRRPEATPATA